MPNRAYGFKSVLGTKFQKRDAEKRLFRFGPGSEEWLSGICISSSCFTRSWYLETMVPVRLSYKLFPSADIIGTLLCQLQFRYEYGYVYFSINHPAPVSITTDGYVLRNV